MCAEGRERENMEELQRMWLRSEGGVEGAFGKSRASFWERVRSWRSGAVRGQRLGVGRGQMRGPV